MKTAPRQPAAALPAFLPDCSVFHKDPILNQVELLMASNNEALSGRQMIATFKQGDYITEEHVYDSADTDLETQLAIQSIVRFMGSKRDLSGERDISPGMVGRSFFGVAPWDLVSTLAGQVALPDQATSLALSRSVRVADFMERPDGTILLAIESS